MGDEQSKVIAEKVNLGRALTALDLEQVVLNNGAIPNSPLMERAALVRGMLQGMLDEGSWQSALQSVYTPQTTVRSLFDGDYAQFKNDVIVSAAGRKETAHIEKDTFEVLRKNWTPDELYELAMKGNIHEESFIHIMESITDKLSDDKKRQAHLVLAQRYITQGNREYAYKEFMRAGAEEDVEKLFMETLAKPDRYGRHDLKFALKIAEDTKDQTKRGTRIGTVLKHAATIIAQKKADSGFGDFDGFALYNLITKHAIPFEPKELDHIVELAARDAQEYQIRDIEDGPLQLRWAQTHYKERPGTAYRMFKSHKYEGAEVVESARLGLLNHQQHAHNENISQLSIERVAQDDLKAIMRYEGLPWELRANVAAHLKDVKTLREMSHKFYKRAQKNKHVEQRVRDLRTAYNLWFNAEGSTTDSYANKLRAELTLHEVKENGRAYLHWLNWKDVEGHRQAHAILLKHDAAFAAYDIGTRLYRETNNLADAALVQTARERAVKKNPEHAFKHFLSEKDEVGVNLAMAGISEKYNLSPNTLKPFLDHIVQEKMKKE